MTTKTNDSKHIHRLDLRKEHPDTWLAVDQGDEIVGVVSDIVSAWSDVKNGYYPILELSEVTATGYVDDVKTLRVHGMATVLFNEIGRLKPKPGETIKITYMGDREARTRGYSATAVYRLRVKGRSPDEAAALAYENIYANGPVRQHGAETPQPEPEAVQGTLPVADDDIPF